MQNLSKQEYSEITKDTIQLFQTRMILFFKQYFENGTAYDSEVIGNSKSKKISSDSGTLVRSLEPGKPHNIAVQSGTPTQTEFEFGTDLVYASQLENGGHIKSKGKMAKWFWWQYLDESQPHYKNPYYRNLALHVQKYGGVYTPPRPFFNPAIEKFETHKMGLNLLMEEMFNKIKNKFEQND